VVESAPGQFFKLQFKSGVTAMSTVSSVSTSNAYGYSLALTGAGVAASSSANAVKAQVAAIQSSLVGTLASLGNNNSSSALTYNAAGLLNTFQQVQSNQTAVGTTSAQAAQNAILAANNTITQTLSSLASGSSSKQTSSDLYSLLGLTAASGSSNSLGLSQGSSLNTTAAAGTKAQASQNAVLAAQNVVTQTLNSLLTSPTSTVSSLGI
jgi:hypothetical protein